MFKDIQGGQENIANQLSLDSFDWDKNVDHFAKYAKYEISYFDDFTGFSRNKNSSIARNFAFSLNP